MGRFHAIEVGDGIEKLTKDSFIHSIKEADLALDQVVFIFPGNSEHHPQNSLFPKVTQGHGLAKVARKLCDSCSTLSLPTTWRDGEQVSDAIKEEAVADLWRMVGFGYSLVLPVRKHIDDTYFSEWMYKFEEDEYGFEPAFFGGSEHEPNLVLADFYSNNLYQLRKFLNKSERKQVETAVPEDFRNAYNEGVQARAQKDAGEALTEKFMSTVLSSDSKSDKQGDESVELSDSSKNNSVKQESKKEKKSERVTRYLAKGWDYTVGPVLSRSMVCFGPNDDAIDEWTNKLSKQISQYELAVRVLESNRTKAIEGLPKNSPTFSNDVIAVVEKFDAKRVKLDERFEAVKAGLYAEVPTKSCNILPGASSCNPLGNFGKTQRFNIAISFVTAISLLLLVLGRELAVTWSNSDNKDLVRTFNVVSDAVIAFSAATTGYLTARFINAANEVNGKDAKIKSLSQKKLEHQRRIGNYEDLMERGMLANHGIFPQPRSAEEARRSTINTEAVSRARRV